MLKRSTVVLVIVFAVLLALAAFLPKQIEQHFPTPTPTLLPAAEKFLPFDVAGITSLTVQNAEGRW
jgi:hypothetical protein